MASLAADAQVEAIDGPNAVGALEGKSMPILTRLPNGKIGFRMMGKFAKSAAPAPIVKVTLENGATVRVGPEQIFFKEGMVETPASELKAGDPLIPVWHYKEGYAPPDLPNQRPSDGTLLVAAVADDGEGDVFHAPIRETGIFFLTVGPLCKA